MSLHIRRHIARWGALLILLVTGIVMFSPLSLHAQESTEHARKVLTRTQPQYPQLARSLNISGSVRIEAVIAPNGSLKSLQIIGGHPLLAQAAQEAVKQWKWEPNSHETTESIEVRFHP